MPPLKHVRVYPPGVLEYRGARVAVGARVYLALRALAAGGGRVGERELCAEVWGDRYPGRKALWSLARRVSVKLAGVGYPGRAAVAAGEVALVGLEVPALVQELVEQVAD